MNACPSPTSGWNDSMNTRMIPMLLSAALLVPAVFAQQPSPPLTIERVKELYIQNNLELQVARHAVERSKADQIAARLRPNPEITFAAENLAIHGTSPFGQLYEVAATYSERIELGGKRALREQAANHTVSVAEAQFEEAMRRGLAEAKRLYYAAILARYNLEAATENRQTFDELVQFNVTRFREGAIAEGDLIKVRLERMQFDSAVRQAELTLRQATIRLIEKLGGSTFSNQGVEGLLTLQSTNLDRETLRQLALSERSDVRVAAREVDAAKARLNLEAGKAKPDLSPFAGYKRIGNDNTLLVGVTVPLKLRDRNQAGIGRAEADVKIAESRLQLVRNRAVAEVEAAFEALRSAQQAAEAFQNDLLRPADEARTISMAAYEEGGTDLMPVLEAQRTRAQIRLQYFKTLFDYRASLVDLELAVGEEIRP
jgi:outer membrane protein, heavy metal efflux system